MKRSHKHVIARGRATKVLDMTKYVFDTPTLLVDALIMPNGNFAVLLARDNGLGISFLQLHA